MLPFCGYHIGDYFSHWLAIAKKVEHPPLIFNVNWFRTDANGKFAWPGFGQNMRVLKWIVERCLGKAHAVRTALDFSRRYDDLDWRGLEFGPERFATVIAPRRCALAERARGPRRALLQSSAPRSRRSSRKSAPSSEHVSRADKVRSKAPRNGRGAQCSLTSRRSGAPHALIARSRDNPPRMFRLPHQRARTPVR